MKLLVATLFLSLTITCQSLMAQPVHQSNRQTNANNISTHVVDFTALDYAFAIPSEIPAGWVTFRMVNMGKEEHVAVVDKIADSLSLKQARELTQTDGRYQFYKRC